MAPARSTTPWFTVLRQPLALLHSEVKWPENNINMYQGLMEYRTGGVVCGVGFHPQEYKLQGRDGSRGGINDTAEVQSRQKRREVDSHLQAKDDFIWSEQRLMLNEISDDNKITVTNTYSRNAISVHNCLLGAFTLLTERQASFLGKMIRVNCWLNIEHDNRHMLVLLSETITSGFEFNSFGWESQI